MLIQPFANFFLQILVVNSKFNSPKPVDDKKLLFPPFFEKVNECIEIYKQTYPNQDVTFAETYRSNVLQDVYFNNGASKIKKDGMHHYGIAADSVFVIGGKRSYKGDINLLRKIYKDNGLTILGLWDALHVQLIPVDQQPDLRNTVASVISKFQQQNGLAVTEEADEKTIAIARNGQPEIAVI